MAPISKYGIIVTSIFYTFMYIFSFKSVSRFLLNTNYME